MRLDTFPRGVLFAAVAAAGVLPWLVVAAPLVGFWNARALYLVAVGVLYASGLTSRTAGRVAFALASILVGLCMAVAARTTAELALGLAALLGVLRSGFAYRSSPARSALIETALLGGGLLFARFLGGLSPLSTAVALWGFLLVQSFFFLIPGVRTRRAARRRGDPFEEAHRRAEALLERC